MEGMPQAVCMLLPCDPGALPGRVFFAGLAFCMDALATLHIIVFLVSHFRGSLLRRPAKVEVAVRRPGGSAPQRREARNLLPCEAVRPKSVAARSSRPGASRGVPFRRAWKKDARQEAESSTSLRGCAQNATRPARPSHGAATVQRGDSHPPRSLVIYIYIYYIY